MSLRIIGSAIYPCKTNTELAASESFAATPQSSIIVAPTRQTLAAIYLNGLKCRLHKRNFNVQLSIQKKYGVTEAPSLK